MANGCCGYARERVDCVIERLAVCGMGGVPMVGMYRTVQVV